MPSRRPAIRGGFRTLADRGSCSASSGRCPCARGALLASDDPERVPGVDFAIDVVAWVPDKAKALRAHRSQHLNLDRIFFSKPDSARLLGTELFRQGWGPALDGSRPARDVFDGLEPEIGVAFSVISRRGECRPSGWRGTCSSSHSLTCLNLKEFTMRAKWLVTSLIVCVSLAFAPLSAQQAAPAAPTAPAAQSAPTAKKAMELGDILAWKSMGAVGRCRIDGSWLAYRLSSARRRQRIRDPLGDDGQGTPVPDWRSRRRRGGPWAWPCLAACSSRMTGSGWAFTVYPTRAEAARLKKQRRTPHNKLRLLDLTSGKDVTIDNVRRFAFAGERGGWLAIQKDPPIHLAARRAAPPAARPQAARRRAAGAASDRRRAPTSSCVNWRPGAISTSATSASLRSTRPAASWRSIIDAADKAGNGVQLRWMDDGRRDGARQRQGRLREARVDRARAMPWPS